MTASLSVVRFVREAGSLGGTPVLDDGVLLPVVGVVVPDEGMTFRHDGTLVTGKGVVSPDDGIGGPDGGTELPGTGHAATTRFFAHAERLSSRPLRSSSRQGALPTPVPAPVTCDPSLLAAARPAEAHPMNLPNPSLEDHAPVKARCRHPDSRPHSSNCTLRVARLS